MTMIAGEQRPSYYDLRVTANTMGNRLYGLVCVVQSESLTKNHQNKWPADLVSSIG